jgi:hypothetical protein
MTVHEDRKVEITSPTMRARFDRGFKAALMLAAATGDVHLVVEINGMQGIAQVGTEEGLRLAQERGHIGAYLVYRRAEPRTDVEEPTIETLEYRFGAKCWRFDNGMLIYDDRERTGTFVASEGIVSYLPDEAWLQTISAGGIGRTRTFSEAVRLIALFSTGHVRVDWYKHLIGRGILRVD